MLERVLTELRTARLRQGLTQAELGARAGYSRSAIYYLESGRRGVRLETVADCAQALGLEITLAPKAGA